MGKERTPVPPEVSAEVLFLQDHTCCVCREPGKAVQLHHIDEDPTHHSIRNLAVLCFDDHDRTQVRGGFGKRLLSAEVEQYRDDWLERVAQRRAKADELAVASMGRSSISSESSAWSPPPNAQLVAYINHLPALRRAAYENARPEWDSGVTAQMSHVRSDRYFGARPKLSFCLVSTGSFRFWWSKEAFQRLCRFALSMASLLT
jgi:hypothetical protein